MLIQCACGMTCRPTSETCPRCGLRVQSAEQAAAKQREWDALSPALRAELEKDLLAAEQRVGGTLKARRLQLAALIILPAAVFPAVLNINPPRLGPSSLLAVALGAIAGWLYFLTARGPLRGALIFALFFVGACAHRALFVLDSKGFAGAYWVQCLYLVGITTGFGAILGALSRTGERT